MICITFEQLCGIADDYHCREAYGRSLGALLFDSEQKAENWLREHEYTKILGSVRTWQRVSRHSEYRATLYSIRRPE